MGNSVLNYVQGTDIGYRVQAGARTCDVSHDTHPVSTLYPTEPLDRSKPIENSFVNLQTKKCSSFTKRNKRNKCRIVHAV